MATGPSNAGKEANGAMNRAVMARFDNSFGDLWRIGPSIGPPWPDSGVLEGAQGEFGNDRYAAGNPETRYEVVRP